MSVETTLVLVKPDAIWMGLTGEIISRIARANLRIVGCKMCWLTKAQADAHYHDLADRAGQTVFDAATAYLTSGPVMALAVCGEEASTMMRSVVMAGVRDDYPSIAEDIARAQGIPLQNRIHCSNPAEPGSVDRELALYFEAGELIPSYPTAADGMPVVVPARV